MPIVKNPYAGGEHKRPDRYYIPAGVEFSDTIADIYHNIYAFTGPGFIGRIFIIPQRMKDAFQKMGELSQTDSNDGAFVRAFTTEFLQLWTLMRERGCWLKKTDSAQRDEIHTKMKDAFKRENISDFYDAMCSAWIFLTDDRQLNLSNEPYRREPDPKLTTLLPQIAWLVKLNDVKIRNHALTDLPEEFELLQGISTLDLGKNSFETVPDCLAKLPRLREVCFSTNQLREFPDALLNMQKLNSLNLHSNRITSLPQTIDKLKTLRVLYLDKNPIEELPETFFNLTDLRELSLFKTNLTEVPENFSVFQQLKMLDLGGLALRTVPEGVLALKNLEKLYLEHCGLKRLPADIDELTNLEQLHLENNNLEDLPKSIMMMEKLERIDLKNNKIPVYIKNGCLFPDTDNITEIKTKRSDSGYGRISLYLDGNPGSEPLAKIKKKHNSGWKGPNYS